MIVIFQTEQAPLIKDASTWQNKKGEPETRLLKPLLAPQTKLFDELAITLIVFFHQILKKTTTLTDHHQKTTSGVEIFAVCFQVLGKLSDSVGQHGHLDFRRTGVFAMGLVALDELLLAIC